MDTDDTAPAESYGLTAGYACRTDICLSEAIKWLDNRHTVTQLRDA
jgi:hypothetical protein